MAEQNLEMTSLASADDQQSPNLRRRSVKFKFSKISRTGEEIWDTSTILSSFCTDTTSEGFKRLYKSKGLRKVFWIILMLAMLTLLITHVSLLIGKFIRFDTATDSTVVWWRKQKFPAVTICNKNMLKAVPISRHAPSDDRSFDDLLDYIELAKKDPTIGHKKEDFIVKATFEQQRLSLDDFELTLNSVYGNCYTFNNNNTRSTKRALPGYGLDLILNIESYAYETSRYRPVDWAGAVVEVHHPDVAPLPEESGISVGPGTLNKLALTQTELVRLGGHYSDCLRDDDEKPLTYYEGLYVKQHCDNTCLQREVIRRCCCTLKIIPHNMSEFEDSWPLRGDNSWSKPEDKDVCYKNNVSTCLDADLCWHDVWNRYDRDELPCSECKPLCRETAFQVSTVSLKWPTSSYAKKELIPELESIDPSLHRKIEAYTLVESNITSQTIEDNFLKVQIYFHQMRTERVTEIPAVENSEFVAEIGGALGFWLGWTLLTLFELLELVANLVLMKVKRRTMNNQIQEENSNAEESQ